MPFHPARTAGRLSVPALALVSLATSTACGGRPPAVAAPAVDARQLALALEDRSSLREPIRVIFAWQLNEAGVRVKGRGVARIEPPYKARLDLFLGNDETLISAALVDGELRLPPGAPTNILPPPDLMWGVLGVFRPDRGTELLGGDRMTGGALRLRYRYDDGRGLDFTVVDGRVRALELLDEGGHVAQRVELELGTEDRYPLNATYRNLGAFRELKLTRESVKSVEAYPPDIWHPSGARIGG
jgi:hypothetical protein